MENEDNNKLILDCYTQWENVLNFTINHIESKHSIVLNETEKKTLNDIETICEEIEATYKKDMKHSVFILLSQLQKISDYYFRLTRVQQRKSEQHLNQLENATSAPDSAVISHAGFSFMGSSPTTGQVAETDMAVLFSELEELVESLNLTGVAVDTSVHKDLIISLEAFLESNGKAFVTNINDLTKFIVDMSIPMINW